MKSVVCISIIIFAVLLWFNPFYIEGSSKEDQELIALQQSEFYQIYTKIFKPSCSLAGCHDGSFEPNFSSIQSSYSTLVWHPLIKNNREEKYHYRVVPGDTASSVLYKRITECCFVDQDDRMPFYDQQGLSKEHIQLISDWILNGAKDIFDAPSPASCYFPYFGNLEISSQPLKGEEKVVHTVVENFLNEPVYLSVDGNGQKLFFRLPIFERTNLCLPLDSMTYELLVFEDMARTKCMHELTQKLRLIDKVLVAEIPLNLLTAQKPYYFQLAVTAREKKMLFTNILTRDVHDYKWSIIIMN